jgi:hypothetical protein
MGIIDELEKKNKLKKGNYSPEMVDKEFRVGQKDLESAQKSLVDENYKWSQTAI